MILVVELTEQEHRRVVEALYESASFGQTKTGERMLRNSADKINYGAKLTNPEFKKVCDAIDSYRWNEAGQGLRILTMATMKLFKIRDGFYKETPTNANK